MSELPHRPQYGNTEPPVSARAEDQDRTLRALHQLERAAGAPLRADPATWQRALLEALTGLDQAMAEEQANAEKPESLLSAIAHTQPRLRSRTRGTRVQYRQLRAAVAELRSDIDSAGAHELDLDDLRRRVARLASKLRYQRARESDLIYEAYYDTFDADIESGIT